MVVGHRLPPVSHGECGIGGLRADERLGGGGVLEVVEEREAGGEVGLRRGGARVREVDPPEAAGADGSDGRGGSCRPRSRRGDEEQE